MSVWDDFKAKYVQPRIENITVGFSGIDPDEKGSGLTDEQINDLILMYLSKLTIKIDSGNLDPDAQEPEVPYISLKPSEIPHEQLDGLQGGMVSADGKTTEHYHLTKDELDELGKLIEALIQDGKVVLPSGGTKDHEALSNLLGGIVNSDGTKEHYHFTEDEWIKIRKLLDTVFPSGSVTPVIPSTPSPPGSDEEDGDDEDLATDAGLSPSDPPEWESSQLPKDCYLYEDAGNLYYGTIADHSEPKIRTALVIPVVSTPAKDKTTGKLKIDEKTTICIHSTIDLVTWDSLFSSITKKTYGKTLADCIYIDWNEPPLDSDSDRKFYCITYPSTADKVNRRGTASSTGLQGLAKGTKLVAVCLSASKEYAIFVTDGGTVSRLKQNVTRYKDNATNRKKDRVGQASSVSVTQVKGTTSCNIKANMGCVVWIPAYNCFCVSGQDGVAVSGTGETWTKKAADGTNVPIDLRGLTFRPDIEYIDNGGQKYTGCAFGWSADDKTFWKSYDGQHWMRHNSTPIPLKEVKSVAYSPETGIYCAAGTPKSDDGGLSVYFSKNLAAWTKVKVTIDDLKAESVIWMASTGKFVLMPSSGSYLYTFKAADWK